MFTKEKLRLEIESLFTGVKEYTQSIKDKDVIKLEIVPYKYKLIKALNYAEILEDEKMHNDIILYITGEGLRVWMCTV